MTKQYLVAILMSILSLHGLGKSSCNAGKQIRRNGAGYIIHCRLIGFADKTLFYLEDRSTESGVIIDSALLTSGRLTFKGKLKSAITYALLRPKDFSEYVFLWVENRSMHIVSVKGQLHSAVITGGWVQNDQNRLNAKTVPIQKTVDSLNIQFSRNESPESKKQISAVIKSKRDEELSANMAFIKNNPNSIVSAEVLNVYASSIGRTRSETLYNNFSAWIKLSAYGREIHRFLSLNENVQVGHHYIDFAEADTSGKYVRISDFDGKFILIDFWASWCSPCRRENPELVKTYSEFKDKGLIIIGVSLDDSAGKPDWIAAVKHDGLTWPNISDLKGDRCDAALTYGINGIPDNFLINKRGVIIARNLRGDDLRNKLKELLP